MYSQFENKPFIQSSIRFLNNRVALHHHIGYNRQFTYMFISVN